MVVLAITSSALWIASRLEIPALHLHPPAVSASLHMSGRDARTPAGHIYASEIPSQRRSTPIPPPYPYTLIHTDIQYLHGFRLASFEPQRDKEIDGEERDGKGGKTETMYVCMSGWLCMGRRRYRC